MPHARVLLAMARAKYEELPRGRADDIVAALGGRQRVRLEVAARPPDLDAVLREAAGTAAVAVIGGGDGTLNACAPALADTGLPLAILPLGTANDLARTLAIPTEPVAAARLALEGARRWIDLGDVDGRPFFSVAGIGLGVAVTQHLSDARKRRWKALAYAATLADVWRSRRTFRVWLDVDGESVSMRVLQLSVGNGRYHGGGLAIAEDAEIDDARLDVCAFAPQTWLRLLAMLPDLPRGRQVYWRNVAHLKGKTVTVETRRPRKITVDGELAGETPARFIVRPRAVQVCVRAA